MCNKQKQHGAVAIEFAAVFVLFMVMVFGIITFGIPTAIRMAFQHYSAEAARAAMIVPSGTNDYETQIADIVNAVVSESWLDEGWLSPCTLSEDWQSTLSDYAFIRDMPDSTTNQLQVCLESTHDFILPFDFFGFEFPPLPRDSDGSVVIRGYTIITL